MVDRGNLVLGQPNFQCIVCSLADLSVIKIKKIITPKYESNPQWLCLQSEAVPTSMMTSTT